MVILKKCANFCVDIWKVGVIVTSWEKFDFLRLFTTCKSWDIGIHFMAFIIMKEFSQERILRVDKQSSFELAFALKMEGLFLTLNVFGLIILLNKNRTFMVLWTCKYVVTTNLHVIDKPSQRNNVLDTLILRNYADVYQHT